MAPTLTLIPGIGDIDGNRTYLYDNTGQSLDVKQVFSEDDIIEITFISTNRTDNAQSIASRMSLVYDGNSSTTTKADVLLTDDDINKLFGGNVADDKKSFMAIIYDLTTSTTVELARFIIEPFTSESIMYSFNPAQNVSLINIQDNENRSTLKVIPLHNHTVIPDSTRLYVQAVQYTVHSGTSSSNFFTVKTVPITPAPTNTPTVDAFWKNSDDSYTLVIAGLQNGEVYEATVFLEYNTGTSSNSSPSVQLYPTAVANAIESLSIDTLFIEGNLINASNVKITGTWEDNDALSYRSYSYDSTSDVRTYYPDGSNSLIKVRFGSSDAIYDASGVYNYTGDFSNNIFEVILTNGQLKVAANALLTVPSQPLVIEAILPILDWSTYQAVITQGIELRAQLIADVVGNNLLDEPGIISDPIQAYIQTEPILQNPKVATNLVSGEQTFYFNGEILSLDVSGASFKIFNKDVDLSVDSAVSLQTSLPNIVERDVTISNVTNGDIIYAILSVPDRNGTIDPLSNDVYIYSVNTQPFIQTRLTQPEPAVYNFTGNNPNLDPYLHTVLTNINNDSVSTSGYDASANSIIWQLYHYVDSNNTLIDTSGNYQIVNGNVDISYNFDVTQDYYLQVTKTGTLNMVGTNYNDYLYNVNDSLALTISTVSSPNTVPIYFMANPTIENIKVSVEVATGDQTFYFDGQIPSLDASGASLSVTNGESSIIDGSAVVLNQSDSSNIQQKFVVQTYDEITSGANIVATLVQLDRNDTRDQNGDVYTYSASSEFVTTKFKTPDNPSVEFEKNTQANDDTMYTTITALGNNNGYDITNISWQVSFNEANDDNLLADISGVYDVLNDSTIYDTELPIDGSGNFVVDAPYYLKVTTSYELPNDVYNNYNNHILSPNTIDASGNTSLYSDPVYYMGNPTIDSITINGQSIEIEVYTHGTTLATEAAFTLVLVAKDGLSGYANGVLSGNMGTSVFVSGVTTIDGVTLVEGSQSLGDNKNYVYTFNINNNPTIDNNATCIGIVDVINGNSAVSLSNFPSVTVNGVLTNTAFNSATN